MRGLGSRAQHKKQSKSKERTKLKNSKEPRYKIDENGEELTFEELLSRYQPLINSAAMNCKNIYKLRECDIDDLKQISYIALFNAARHYSPDKSVTFGAYAKTCIVNALQNYAKKQLKDSSESVLLDDELLQGDSFDSPETVVVSNEYIEELKSRINASLSDYEKKILKLYISNYSYEKMADMTGKSVKSVDNAITRIKSKIKIIINRQ